MNFLSTQDYIQVISLSASAKGANSILISVGILTAALMAFKWSWVRVETCMTTKGGRETGWCLRLMLFERPWVAVKAARFRHYIKLTSTKSNCVNQNMEKRWPSLEDKRVQAVQGSRLRGSLAHMLTESSKEKNSCHFQPRRDEKGSFFQFLCELTVATLECLALKSQFTAPHDNHHGPSQPAAWEGSDGLSEPHWCR